MASKWLGIGLGILPIALASACLTRQPVKQEPITNNVFVRRQPSTAIDKIDLLFVVDNSSSMGDKQEIFKQAVPRMLERLVRPDCVQRDSEGNVIARSASAPPAAGQSDPTCPSGGVLEFRPVKDIHIGVISSSLGGHGAEVCAGPENNDRALFMPRVRENVPDPHGTGFLVWRPVGQEGEPLEGDIERLKEQFRLHIGAAGEAGCGFEAPLEAWYRFLVDPSPPLQVKLESGSTQPVGVDQQVLDQRRAFLRPDSLLTIVMLTDENDCSIMDGAAAYPHADWGWMTAGYTDDLLFPDGHEHPQNFAQTTAYCQTNPNHACCFSCFEEATPSGCSDPEAIKICERPGSPRHSPEDDRPNLRCFDQRRRFGVDTLYPIERYVSALRDAQVKNAEGDLVDNPIFVSSSGEVMRDPSLVFISGITGIPWQDIADAESLASPDQLRYLTAFEMREKNLRLSEAEPISRWDLILGRKPKAASDPSCGDDSQCGQPPVPPFDPFMRESMLPREGTNPVAGISITQSPAWNDINGHEQNPSLPYNTVAKVDDTSNANDDLQYSCIFPLAPYGAVKLDCSDDDNSCDCDHGPERDRALCKAGPGQPATNDQHFGKAYPSTRVLDVLQKAGDSAVVASICPKIHDPASPDFGYNPAVAAIVDRLADRLRGPCLPRPLDLTEEGELPCRVVEVLHPRDGGLSCAADRGRVEVPSSVEEAVKRQLSKSDFCTEEDCANLTMCEIEATPDGPEREACLSAPLGAESTLAPGYCYIDPEKGWGDPALVSACKVTERRMLRFVGADTPASKTTLMIACLGDEVSARDEIPEAPAP